MLTKICKLCLRHAQLRDSHIIPSSMHKMLKDKQGKNVRFVLPGKLTEKNQSDLKEPMLCDVCEGVFSRFEKTTIELLRPLWKSSRQGRMPYVIPGKSTDIVLSFVRSVFWRASVSTILPKYQLHPSEEDALRVSLLNKVPVAPKTFPVKLNFFSFLRRFDSSNIMQAPAMCDNFSDAKFSAFVSMGIIFSMQSPAITADCDLNPYLAAGEPYKIEVAPSVIAAPCIAAVVGAQEIAKRSAK